MPITDYDSYKLLIAKELTKRTAGEVVMGIGNR